MSDSARNDDEAARWAIRLDGEPLDDAEQAELDAWLLADDRRRGALLRAEAALAYLDRGRALTEPREAEPSAPPFFARRAFLIGGSLGGLAAAAGVVGLLLARSETPMLEIETAIGEVRRVTLRDGSIASVNTDSRIEVAMSGRQRRVTLAAGEAWFQVVPDRSRPFLVDAGDARIQAVGTAFSVRRRDGGSDVLVTEGVVEAWLAGREDRRTRVAAGSRTFIADVPGAIEVVRGSDEIERALAWRTGELALNGESLAYAVAELNRYNRRKLVIADDTLGSEPLVGYFRTDQPENFGRAVATMVGARVEVEGDTIRLSR